MGNKRSARLRGLEWLGSKIPLTYKTPKFIKVDVPIVAIFHRTCQGMAFALALLQLYMNDGWAYAETPGGMANAWDESGTMLFSTDDPTLPFRTPYCSNASLSYAYRTYVLERPECEALMPAELTDKKESSLFFATSFIETETFGWPCNSSSHAARAAQCSNNGSTPLRRGWQCGCRQTRALYPLAVEEMEMAFEHAYATTNNFGWLGSSADPNSGSVEGEEGLYSNLKYGNGTEQRFAPGAVLSLSIREWLKAANISLDEINPSVPADPSGRRAPRRSTGVNVRVDISYTNADRVTGRAVPGKRSMHADVSLRPELSTWTGVGTSTNWVTYPTLHRSIPQEYHLVERWKHGILFQFHVTGQVYRFDFFYLLTVLIGALVMLKFANIAADGVAFYMLPGGQSTLLRNKRQEVVSKRSEFAEIGMKAALAAATYRSFDPDNNGTIEAVDIVKVFAHVEGVSWQQAHAIAHMILLDADTSDEGEVEGGPGGLSYVEYMTCLEGDAINFDQFLKHLTPAKGATDMEECEAAFNEERAKLPPIAGRPGAAAISDEEVPEESNGVGIFTPLGLSEEEKADRLTRKGVLRLHLKFGKGLKAADKTGTSDPYVIALCGKQQLRSKVVYKTLDPRFDEQLSFKAMRLERMVDKGLGMVVMDKDEGLLDADDVLGKVSVSLDCLKDADNVQFNEPLKGEKGNLIFSLEWIDAGSDSSSKKKKKGGGGDGTDSEAPQTPGTPGAGETGKSLPSPVPLPPPGAGAVSDGAESPSPGKKEKKKKKVREEAGLETPETVQQI